MELNALWQNLKEGKYNLYLVIGLGIILFIPFLGSVGLHDPWETHYGEVARSMLVRNDYIFPYWESGYFFSKPVLLMWMMAAGMHIFGVNEWGVRFFVAVLSILCMAITYWGVSRLINKRVGILTTFVMATSPLYLFLSKQAITDMPFVGNMTIGMIFLALGLIERDESVPSLKSRVILTIVVLLSTITQYALMINSGHMMKGLTTAAIILIFAGLLAGYFAFTRKRQYEIFLFYGYIFIAFATLAKGIGGFAIPGAIWLLYILVTGDWGILKRAMLPIGVFVFGIIAVPWYATLLSFNGRDTEGFTFYGRFFVHDHFNRLAAGVHGDRGSFEYFIQQLGFGMFPWSAIIPFAYVSILKEKILDATKEFRTILLYTLWGVFTYVFFHLMITKFHHYIFPAVPGIALVVAIYLDRLLDDPERENWLTKVIIFVFFIILARDIILDQRLLVNLFTYKYDRPFPNDVIELWKYIAIFTIGGALVVYFYIFKKQKYAIYSYMATALAFGLFLVHVYFNLITPHYSQKYLFDTYYKMRKDNEPIAAYLMNWRGETFYSKNTVRQLKSNSETRSYADGPGRKFILVEASRYNSLKNALSEQMRDKIRIVDRSSNKFYLTIVDPNAPSPKDKEKKPDQPQEPVQEKEIE